MANAKLDENSRPTLTALSNVDGVTIVDLYADPVTHRLLVDPAGGAGGGTGTWYTVSGTMDGSNVTFTVAVSVTSDFQLFFERQPQMLYDGVDGDFTYVAGASSTTITYRAGSQPFNGATLHRAFVIS